MFAKYVLNASAFVLLSDICKLFIMKLYGRSDLLFSFPMMFFTIIIFNSVMKIFSFYIFLFVKLISEISIFMNIFCCW